MDGSCGEGFRTGRGRQGAGRVARGARGENASGKIRPLSANQRVVGRAALWHLGHVKTILTPIDFSGTTDAVVGQAGALAKALDAQVVLLNVLQPPVITSEYGPFMENIGEIVLVAEKSAAKQLAKLQGELAEGGIKSEIQQLTGAPVTSILKQAEKLEADYIVMGSHGHTAFYDLLVGSTTHGVLLKSRCPVVIVPAQKKKAAKK